MAIQKKAIVEIINVSLALFTNHVVAPIDYDYSFSDLTLVRGAGPDELNFFITLWSSVLFLFLNSASCSFTV